MPDKSPSRAGQKILRRPDVTRGPKIADPCTSKSLMLGGMRVKTLAVDLSDENLYSLSLRGLFLLRCSTISLLNIYSMILLLALTRMMGR